MIRQKKIVLVVALLCCGLFAGASYSAVTKIETDGLSVTFDGTGLPISVQNAKGEELLGSKGSKGFYLREFDKTERRFDSIEKVGANEYAFSFRNGSPEKVQAQFSGRDHMLRVEFTKLEGFPLKGESLRFGLNGREKRTLNGVALDWMTEDSNGNSAPWGVVAIERRSLWEINEHNPLGSFIVYERVNDQQEDDVLFDIWVNEGAPHPKVDGPWDRKRAEAWLDDFIELQYDSSALGLTPNSPEELKEFFPYAKLADAKLFHINFRKLLGHQIDVPNKQMFPGGMKDLQQFARDAKANGQRLVTHRMSAAIWYVDPEYVKGPDGLHPDFEGIFTMEVAKKFKPGDKQLFLKSSPDVQMPIIWHGPGARPPYPYPYLPKNFKMGHYDIGGYYVSTDTLPEKLDDSGNWVLEGGKLSQLNKGLPVGTRVKHLLRGNAFFIPAYNSKLFEEIAIRYANFSNDVPLYDVSTDGAAWYMARGHWAFEKFMTIVYENMKHPTMPSPSHAKIPYAWIEYRFNRTRAAMGGAFSTRGGTSLNRGNGVRATTGLEFMFDALGSSALMGNSRSIGVSHDLNTTLAALEGQGNIVEVLTAIKDYKNASFAMSPEQRKAMGVIQHKDVDWKNKHLTKIWGTWYGDAVWWIDGSIFRKWIPVVNEFYENKYYRGMEHGTIVPRMYAQSGEALSLVVPETAKEAVDQVRVVGRLLPRFEENHPENIDLMAEMGVGSDIVISRENDTDQNDRSLNNRNNWDNFTTYPTKNPIALLPNRGIGIRVVGDGSGSLLVVRVTQRNRGRDYVFPVDFTGERWLIAADPQQGWTVKNWGWSGATTKTAGKTIDQVSLGLGYVPPNTKSSVKVTALKALRNISEPLVDPIFTVGDQTVEAKGNSIGTYNFFELSSDGQLKVYDPFYNLVKVTSTGAAFHPSDLSSFGFSSKTSPKGIWMEAAVQVAAGTQPNPAKASTVIWTGSGEGAWTSGSTWDRGSAPKAEDNVIIGGRSTVTGGTADFNMLTVRAGSTLNLSGLFKPGQYINIYGTLNMNGTCDLSGTRTRLAGTLGKGVQSVKLNGGEITLHDGLSFANPQTELHLGGADTELHMVLSPTGFTPIIAGDLKGSKGWAGISFVLELSDYDVRNGTELVLMDFDGHDEIFEDKCNLNVKVRNRDVPLKGCLSFDAETSQLRLSVSR
jgi:hypothetical protein